VNPPAAISGKKRATASCFCLVMLNILLVLAGGPHHLLGLTVEED
jgi:hypothetical protein